MFQKLLIGAGSLALLAPTATANGFQINESSAADFGRANAGRVVQLSDASAAWSNPALMTRFDRPAVTIVASGIFPDSKFKNLGSTDALGAPLTGDAKGILDEGVLPAFHGIYPVSDRLALGFSFYVPFGLGTTYSPDWPGRYQALESKILAFDFNPSLAYAVNEQLSIGVGFSAQYVEAKLTSAVDFGAICLSQQAPATCASLGLLPQQADGTFAVEGDGWDFGYNLGLAWQPSDAVTVGLAYRSGIDNMLRGEADFTLPAQAAIFAPTGLFDDGPGQAGIDFPATAELGISVNATSRTTLYATSVWTGWSSLAALTIDFDNPAQADIVEPLSFEDAWRFGAGLDHELSADWTLRAGLARDMTPVQDGLRVARLPDADRTILALGVGYEASDDWSLDLGYNFITLDEGALDRTGRYGDRLVGEVSGSSNIVSLGLTRRF